MFKCGCGSHAIEIEKDKYEGTSEHYLCHWYYGKTDMGFWARIKYALEIIFQKRHLVECIIIDDYDKFIEYVNQNR